MRYLARFFVAMAAVMLSGVSMAQDVTVDNLDSGATSRVGAWSESSAPEEYDGSSFYSNDTKARFTFIPKLPEAGSYKVEVIWSYHPNRSTSVPHCIVDSDGQACENFNQRDSNADGVWTMLSDGPFNCGTDNCEVTVSAANGQASADAVRWTLLEPTEPPTPAGSFAGLAGPVLGDMSAAPNDGVTAGFVPLIEKRTPDEVCDEAFKGSKAAITIPTLFPLAEEMVEQLTCTPRQIDDELPNYCPSGEATYPTPDAGPDRYRTPSVWLNPTAGGAWAFLNDFDDSCRNWTSADGNNTGHTTYFERSDLNLPAGVDTNSIDNAGNKDDDCDDENYVACYIPDVKK